jgi:hypothetical protein
MVLLERACLCSLQALRIGESSCNVANTASVTNPTDALYLAVQAKFLNAPGPQMPNALERKEIGTLLAACRGWARQSRAHGKNIKMEAG